MIKRFWPPFLEGTPAVGLLFLRLFVGCTMILHGWPKVMRDGEFVMFSWMGPNAPVPGFLQFLAALSEFGGGLALIVGLLTPLASLGIMSTMFVAALSHIQRGDPLVKSGPGPGGSYELAALYFVIGLLFLLTGPGKLSLDALLFRKKDGQFRY